MDTWFTGQKFLLSLLKDYSRLIVYLGVNVPLRLRTSDLRSPFCKSPIDCYWITKVNELKYLKCHYKYDFKTFEVFEEKLVHITSMDWYYYRIYQMHLQGSWSDDMESRIIDLLMSKVHLILSSFTSKQLLYKKVNPVSFGHSFSMARVGPKNFIPCNRILRSRFSINQF